MDDFEEIYNNIDSANYDELENIRKKTRISNCIFCTSFAITFCIFYYMFFENSSTTNSISEYFIYLLIFVIGINIASLTLKAMNHGFKDNLFVNEYKEKIITLLIDSVFEKNRYSPSEYLDILNIKHCCFNPNYNKLYGNDYVSTSIELNNKNIGITFSEIKLINETRDSEGSIVRQLVFNGIAGYAELKTTNEANIKILRNNAASLSANIVKLDSSEFEDLFDIITSNKIIAMQILTSDVMCELVNLINLINVPIEVNVVPNDKIYFRLFTGPAFEPVISKNILDKKTLKEYYNILLVIKKLVELICTTLISCGLGGETNE